MHYDRKSQGLGPAVYLWWRLKCWKVVSADTAMTWPAVFLCFRRVGGRAVCGDGMVAHAWLVIKTARPRFANQSRSGDLASRSDGRCSGGALGADCDRDFCIHVQDAVFPNRSHGLAAAVTALTTISSFN